MGDRIFLTLEDLKESDYANIQESSHNLMNMPTVLRVDGYCHGLMKILGSQLNGVYLPMHIQKKSFEYAHALVKVLCLDELRKTGSGWYTLNCDVICEAIFGVSTPVSVEVRYNVVTQRGFMTI